MGSSTTSDQEIRDARHAFRLVLIESASTWSMHNASWKKTPENAHGLPKTQHQTQSALADQEGRLQWATLDKIGLCSKVKASNIRQIMCITTRTDG